MEADPRIATESLTVINVTFSDVIAPTAISNLFGVVRGLRMATLESKRLGPGVKPIKRRGFN